jgi:hypothetical protein
MAKYHQIEVVNQGDTFESLVERNFRGKVCHRAEDIAPFDVERMVVDMAEALVRSRRDYMVAPSGMARVPFFTNLLFRLEEDLFVLVQHKSNSYGNDQPASENYRVLVTTSTPARALECLEKMRKTYRQVYDPTGAGFFIMGHRAKADRASLDQKHLLTDESLDLHYGEGFSAWSKGFLAGIGEPGISLLRGDVGTGKTSYLRHAMCALASTHRFYFVPVDNFSLLAADSLTEFWKKEHREFPGAKKVLVLEDAEGLLVTRGERGAVSTILNMTDGLMSEYVRLHLVCTLNCDVEKVDAAVLRPGRLKFFREFPRLPWEQAEKLARHYGVEVEKKEDYSLAEIFCAHEPEVNTAGVRKAKRRVGFGR